MTRLKEKRKNLFDRQAVRIKELIQKDAAKSAEILKLNSEKQIMGKEIMKLIISEHEAMKKIREPSKHWQWSCNKSFLKNEVVTPSALEKHSVDDLSRKMSNYIIKKKQFGRIQSTMEKLKKELGKSVCEKMELKKIIKRKDKNLKVMLGKPSLKKKKKREKFLML